VTRDASGCFLLLNFAGGENLGADLMNGVAQADGEQRLAAVLQHVDDTSGGVLDENVPAVGQEVVFGSGGDGLYKALAQLALKESDDLADALEAETATAKFADDGDLGDIVEGVETAMAFAGRHHDSALVPPL
jgi:hypothetical protein